MVEHWVVVPDTRVQFPLVTQKIKLPLLGVVLFWLEGRGFRPGCCTDYGGICVL